MAKRYELFNEGESFGNNVYVYKKAIGGNNDNNYYIDNNEYTIIEKGTSSTDTIYTSVNLNKKLPNNVENIILLNWKAPFYMDFKGKGTCAIYNHPLRTNLEIDKDDRYTDIIEISNVKVLATYNGVCNLSALTQLRRFYTNSSSFLLKDLTELAANPDLNLCENDSYKY